jgi:hypothetical protein
MNNCDTCGFFIPREVCRDDIKTELTNARLDGVCGEITNCVMRLHYIANAPLAKCGKHMKDTFYGTTGRV